MRYRVGVCLWVCCVVHKHTTDNQNLTGATCTGCHLTSSTRAAWAFSVEACWLLTAAHTICSCACDSCAESWAIDAAAPAAAAQKKEPGLSTHCQHKSSTGSSMHVSASAPSCCCCRSVTRLTRHSCSRPWCALMAACAITSCCRADSMLDLRICTATGQRTAEAPHLCACAVAYYYSMAVTGSVCRLARRSGCSAKAHLSFAACLFMLLCSSLQAPSLLLQSLVAGSILLQLISLQHSSVHC